MERKSESWNPATLLGTEETCVPCKDSQISLDNALQSCNPLCCTVVSLDRKCLGAECLRRAALAVHRQRDETIEPINSTRSSQQFNGLYPFSTNVAHSACSQAVLNQCGPVLGISDCSTISAARSTPPAATLMDCMRRASTRHGLSFSNIASIAGRSFATDSSFAANTNPAPERLMRAAIAG